ncbi:hypothetical protein [Brevundimonas sp.]|jgi:hypothetical protein|uniref:hypothetical protein n=1 Tax=Brevundimonas sp. TaxID=1871086 RepID=UPI0037843AF4
MSTFVENQNDMKSVKIQVKLVPSHVEDRLVNVSLHQLGVKALEDWEKLNYVEKNDLVAKYVGKLDQPYWDFEEFKIKP